MPPQSVLLASKILIVVVAEVLLAYRRKSPNQPTPFHYFVIRSCRPNIAGIATMSALKSDGCHLASHDARIWWQMSMVVSSSTVPTPKRHVRTFIHTPYNRRAADSSHPLPWSQESYRRSFVPKLVVQCWEWSDHRLAGLGGTASSTWNNFWELGFGFVGHWPKVLPGEGHTCNMMKEKWLIVLSLLVLSHCCSMVARELAMEERRLVHEFPRHFCHWCNFSNQLSRACRSPL